MPYVFAVTLFVSAALLFCVEPMVAKMVLPLLGGSPAVWNTCLVFFQMALLIGYLYAHASAAWLTTRNQVVLHLGLLGLAMLVLPIHLPELLVDRIPYDADPVPWLLSLLLLSVGLPFFVVAASAPLLQKWFAGTGHPDARDPYYLYAASNLGSMIALLGYPLLLEPNLELTEQSAGWAAGFGVLLLLTAACAIPAWRTALPSLELTKEDAIHPTVLRRLRWIALALVPSSLLLGVTGYVSTDLAAIPLLWVIPLALYLLSFIFVFAQKEVIPHSWMVAALPVLALLAIFTMLRSTATPVWQLIVLHWLVLFVASMVCHGELAKDRPAPRFLTGYYLWISVGGALGGVLTALVAPVVFQGAIIEYPLALVLACLLRPGPGLRDSSSVNRWLDLVLPGVVGALCLALLLARPVLEEWPPLLARAALFGVPALVCWMFAGRPTRFALSLAVMLLVFTALLSAGGSTLYSERNFFGVIRVQNDRDGRFRVLDHGSTEHGIQRLGPDGKPLRPAEALAYFHKDGPVGDVFRVYRERCDEDGLSRNVAVTGLGVGALASYARPGEHWTYYEIDPAMERAARKYFTFLDDCPKDLHVVTGDARLRLRDARDGEYGLIVLDAFSSDAVPTHLISQQALQLYRSKLAPSGLLVFNVSNRYLNLKRVLADLALHNHMVCYGRDHARGDEDKKNGLRDSQWVVIAEREADLGDLVKNPRWEELRGRSNARVWTDGYSNILDVFKW